MTEHTLCYRWTTPWPHAYVDPWSIQTTDDASKVTCSACLHALGSQKHEPPAMTEHTDTETLAEELYQREVARQREKDPHGIQSSDTPRTIARDVIASDWLAAYVAARVDAARRDALTEAASEVHAEARWQAELVNRTGNQDGPAALYTLARLAVLEQILEDRAAALAVSDPTHQERRPCPHCGPGYHYGDDGCRHGVTWADV